MNSELLSIEDALQQLLSSAKPVAEIEHEPLINAYHRVLARPHRARDNVPPADLSAMDGYAVNTARLPIGEWITVSQRIPAGHQALELAPNTAARLFTGSVIPPGANAVVIQEHCEARNSANGEAQVKVLNAPLAGDHIRRCGQDLQADAEILPAGHFLRTQDLGLLAAGGVDHVSVFRRLRVAVLSSGDELVEPGQTLAPGQIYNSNRYTLQGLLADINIDVRHYPRIPDKLSATEHALAQAAAECDLIITTGGVSVGEEDHIKQAVINRGELRLWKLKIKPGKPLAYGAIRPSSRALSNAGATPFFGLPGNPVAVFVTFILTVRPYLLAMQGRREVQSQSSYYPADFAVERANSRQEYLRVRIENGRLLKHPNQDSSVLSSICWANALAIVPPDTRVVPGDRLEVIPYGHL